MKTKPVSLLLGDSISYEDLNDDMLGRHLDAIAAYGTTKLFSEIAFEVAIEHDLLGQSYHLDTTTLKLFGEYEGYSGASPIPALGYSKDHRADLKQVTLSLTQSSKANIPLWMEALDGNRSDKASFQETVKAIEQFQSRLAQAPDHLFFVVDAAFYTPDKLQKLNHVQWITRVPATYKAAKALLLQPKEAHTWTTLDAGYSIRAITMTEGDLPQRWILVDSEKGRKKALGTFLRQLNKHYEKSAKALWHLCNQVFACQEDALDAITKLNKQFKYHEAHFTIEPIYKYRGKGRPKKRGCTPLCGLSM